MVDVFQKSGLDIEVTINRRRPMFCPETSALVDALNAVPHAFSRYTFNGTCDMAFSKAPSIVIGPGKSERSHAADEFIVMSEIADAVDIYTEVVCAYLAA